MTIPERLKILSGDDPIVVKRLAGLVGLNADRVLSGADIMKLTDDALAVQVQSVDAYGRLAPRRRPFEPFGSWNRWRLKYW